ncbi:Putative tagatose-6-phosphate ketose/aldose isomerase [Serratia liquefaciens]|jgi:tagatose-6-phosphate ketose/aldose isomerase|uniref:SIS domain-containing protein n=1 Tax=Serratia liquefaciens TaxID=614 RepID=UPI00217B687E|nr:SIS domain-containing protein [Serratia liquefaciens]CAI0878283.1 Putative tagatose-6-phosphate ketose/aldose isomerase [Serratia liquefaciens]CAI0884278.1 Putative tagatose-6-phosphate ketose/aldose isomerase [Serratia liquefaciens]CAI0898608.1 Putative tagatose-6-phosphate ketose/aldose isomerase [Serratia liquefaciens]CAI1837376.1 Putative tagatose-6-phosphate ketose/aldose isomerase [Serratia liquefaciens]HBL6728787.1 SIS domain-containing protein [Serratia liquefaciens]
MNGYFAYDAGWLEQRHALHTAREIWQQPDLWDALHRQLQEQQALWQPFLAPLLANPRLQIVLCGAGSSAFAGRALAPWLREKTGRDVVAYGTTDIVANPHQYLDLTRPTLLVSFARSGNSPESVATVELADQLLPESYHLMLVCNPDSQLAHYAHQRENVCSLVMPQGSNDQSFAMTSSFSCMMLSAALLLGPHSLTEAQRPLATMVARCRELRETLQPQVKAFAASGFRRYITLGGSCFTGLAEEASLKMLELTAGQIVTRYDSPLGLRHGPKFMVDDQTLVLLMFSSGDYARQYDRDLWNELHRDGLAMQMVGLTGSAQPVSDMMLNLHHAEDDVWLLFPYLLFTQMLAFESSLALGMTPDNPCPTGEVNRVVKGVTIYRYPSSVA